MWADSFHDLNIAAPVLRKVAHCVVAAVVDGARSAFARVFVVGVAQREGGMFELCIHG